MAWDEQLVLALNSAFSAVISMCNQVVTSEIREKFHARFVQIKRNYSLISRVYHLINIIGDELRLQSRIFDMFIPVLSHRSENSTLSKVYGLNVA